MQKFTSFCCVAALLFLACATPVQSKQLAIVVGIDHYDPQTARLTDLKGAVNDARLITDTLRGIGVYLPDSRVLLNEQATVSRFLETWKETVAEAKTGDRIIVTFAGHGNHEPETGAPYDEPDHEDETLLFYDYSRDKPKTGRISDDELFDLFQKASAFSILFVSDSCHAGGMMRSAAIDSPLPSRSGPDEAYYEVDLSMPAKTTGTGDNTQMLENVTYLLAMEDEKQKIQEVIPPGQGLVHGALSFAFAEAIRGLADENGDQAVSRKELSNYIKNRVVALSEHKQFPNLLPRGSEETAFELSAGKSPTLQAKSDLSLEPSDLQVKVEGGSAPSGVRHSHLSNDDNYRLRFVINKKMAKVYNIGGDFVGEILADDAGSWNALIDKYRFLTALDGNPKLVSDAAQIILDKGGKVHPIEERLTFSFDAKSSKKYFMLFDLPGTGRVQFLYPLKEQNDPPLLDKTPYQLPLKVTDPVGEDDLIAVFCERQNNEAVDLLNQYHGKNPPPATDFFQATQGCQIGKYAFFTRNKN